MLRSVEACLISCLNSKSPVHSVLQAVNVSFIIEYVYIGRGDCYTQGFLTLFSGLTSLRDQIQLVSWRHIFSQSIPFLFLVIPFLTVFDHPQILGLLEP